MISPNANLTIQRIPISCLQIKGEYEEPLSPERVMFYYQKLIDHPGMYPGLCYVVPSDTHPNSLCILDGRHRFLASILAGRPDVLAIVQEEGAGKGEHIHELEHCLQSCIDLLSHPTMVNDEHKEAYAQALCSKGLKLLRRETP